MKYRYPGVQTFTRDEGALFFGRKNDEERLYKLTRLEKVVVLYGKSGYGKSSLLQAAVLPRLERETDFVAVPVRFYEYNTAAGKELTPLHRTIGALKDRIGTTYSTETYLDRLIPGENSLWYHFKKAQAAIGKKRFVLVFDQFEELFSYPETSALQFRAQLADLLYCQIPQHFRNAFDNAVEEPEESETTHFFDDIELHVLFSIRSDYLYQLNRLKDFFPQILRHAYELNALTSEQAKEAIVEPARFETATSAITPAFAYTPEALELLLRYLSKNGKEKIESFQLQLICRHIEDKFVREQGQTWIEPSFFGADEPRRIEYLEDVNGNYYASCIAQLPPGQQNVARLIVEKELVTPEDKRRILADAGMLISRYREQGATSELLDALKNTYLLRAETGTRGTAYELSHDALVGPILKARFEREEAEARIERERRLQEAEEKAAAEARGRWRAIFLAAVFFIALVVAFWFYREAEKNLKIANDKEKEREIAEKKRKETQLIILKKDIEIYTGVGEYLMACKKAEEAYNIDTTKNKNWLDSIRVYNSRLEQ